MTKAQLGMLAGVLIGVPVGLAGGTAASVIERAQRHLEQRRGWNGAAALVARKDLPVERPLSMNDVETRSLAEAFVTAAQLKGADFGYVTGRRLRVPVKAGQPLEWSFFDTVPDERLGARDACVAALDAQAGGAR